MKTMSKGQETINIIKELVAIDKERRRLELRQIILFSKLALLQEELKGQDEQ